jgi:hypothetical protein
MENDKKNDADTGGQKPTFGKRYGKGNGRNRRFAADPHIGTANVDFVMPQPDKKRIPNQNFQVISFVAPEGTRVRCKNFAMKPGPTFATEAEANRHAEIIRNEDTRFEVDVIDLYNWMVVPKPEEAKPFTRKQYTDKYMTSVMKGQQQALMQSKKEMDDRVARDRAKAEEELRKKYGPDYVMKKKSDLVNEYENKREERNESVDGMSFTQRELVNTIAKFIVATKSIKPEVAGELLRFMEAAKIAEGSNEISSSSPCQQMHSPPPPSPPFPQHISSTPPLL